MEWFKSKFQISDDLYFAWMQVLDAIQRRRSSHLRCFMKNGVLKNFTKFRVKHLCQSLLSNIMLQALGTLTQVISYEFCKNIKNTSFTEHLWTTASSVFGTVTNNYYRDFMAKIVYSSIKEILSTSPIC